MTTNHDKIVNTNLHKLIRLFYEIIYYLSQALKLSWMNPPKGFLTLGRVKNQANQLLRQRINNSVILYILSS